MAERDRKVETEPRKYGVFLFVTDENNHVLMLTNKVTKPQTQKVTGQLTTPAETVIGRESIKYQTIERTIREEIGAITQIRSTRSLGYVRMGTATPIHLCAFEIKTQRDAVIFKPEDPEEVIHPQWVPLNEIGNQKISIGSHQIPLYRSPIPEFAANLRAINVNISFPPVKRVEPTIPNELFDHLKNNPSAHILSAHGIE